MDDAVLRFDFGVNTLNGFKEVFKAIDTGNQNIFDAPIVQVGQHT